MQQQNRRQCGDFPDHEGLQMIQYDRGLHAIQVNEGLQVDLQRVLESLYPEHVLPDPPKNGECLQTAARSRRARKGFRRWLITVLAIVVIITAVVGYIVGVIVIPNRYQSNQVNTSPTPVNNTSPTPNSSAPPSPSSSVSHSIAKSACQGTVCPQILAADTIGSPASVFVFARGLDNAVWYASAPVASSLPWPNPGAWTSLGGPFFSQPSVKSWNLTDNESDHKLSVFGVWDPDYTVRTKRFSPSGSSWTGSWENLGSGASSQVSLCTVNETRIDAWVNSPSTTTVWHDWAQADDFSSQPPAGAAWGPTATFKNVSGAPGIACRHNAYQHDLLVYELTNGAAQYATWNANDNKWTWPTNIDGAYFVQDPVMLATSDDRFDFFGIGNDSAMYHLSGFVNGASSTGIGSLESVGGAFESVPSVMQSGTDRIDVVALGVNDTILHRVLQDLTWANDWEDLGVFGNSAPLLVNLTTTPAKIGLFVLGYNGEINYTVWTVSSDLSWRGLEWTGLGGNMTSSFFSN